MVGLWYSMYTEYSVTLNIVPIFRTVNYFVPIFNTLEVINMISEFSNRLEHLLNAKSIKKSELAKMLDIPKQTLNGFFGDRIPKAEILIELSKIFNVSIDYLLTGICTDYSYSDEVEYLIRNFERLSDIEKKRVLDYISFATSCIDNTSISPQISIRGNVAAGLPILAVEDTTDTVEAIDRYIAYALRIKGNSMNPVILDGEIVQVKNNCSIENGEIGIFMIDSEVTCKKFYEYDDRIELHSINPEYSPIIISKDSSKDFQLLGKVVLNPDQSARL